MCVCGWRRWGWRMLGMCGRQQHERRRVFSPIHCAPRNQTPKHFISLYKFSHSHQTSRRLFVTKNKHTRRVFRTRARSLFDVKHPAEAEMVWSVVGGTAERSAAGRRRSMNRTGGLDHRLVCIWLYRCVTLSMQQTGFITINHLVHYADVLGRLAVWKAPFTAWIPPLVAPHCDFLGSKIQHSLSVTSRMIFANTGNPLKTTNRKQVGQKHTHTQTHTFIYAYTSAHTLGSTW